MAYETVSCYAADELPSQMPPDFEDYSRLRGLVWQLERSIEEVVPSDILESDRWLEDIATKPQHDGAVDEEFRWFIVEKALPVLADMYRIYNVLPDDPYTGLRRTRRGFSICGPFSAVLNQEVACEQLPFDGTWQLETRLYRPQEQGFPGAVTDHTFLTLRTADGWVHFIDGTGRLLWGPPIDYGRPYVAEQLLRHEVYPTETFDVQLAEDYCLYQFPEDPADPVWQGLYLLNPSSSPDELAVLSEMINNHSVLARSTVYPDGRRYDTPYWGPYLSHYFWGRFVEVLSDIAGPLLSPDDCSGSTGYTGDTRIHVTRLLDRGARYERFMCRPSAEYAAIMYHIGKLVMHPVYLDNTNSAA